MVARCRIFYSSFAERYPKQPNFLIMGRQPQGTNQLKALNETELGLKNRIESFTFDLGLE